MLGFFTAGEFCGKIYAKLQNGGRNMKIPQKKKRYNLALAFAFPFLGMLFVMLISQYEPFGKYAILYSDMYHQYYPFFVEFRRALLSGESLLYNWSVGLGMDYLGLIAYYLASPLNLLCVLVPEDWLLEFFSLLTPLRLGLAGLSFGYMLEKLFGKDDLSVPVFAAFYGLCSWALGYLWNIMWLDTFALLPLVVLGTVYLLRDKKFGLYTVSLFLATFSNYYVAFFVCIFVFLFFFVYEICRWKGFGRFFGDLCRIALFSVLAIGMTAILELPAFAALQTTQSSVNKFPEGFKMNIAPENTWQGMIDAIRQVLGNMAGGISPTFKEGLPNVYTGVGVMMLAFLFMTGQKVKLRDKICAAGLLIFFIFSFILRQLDYIWHGFHFPNMIPYRFSFLFSFVLLYMAYRAWIMREEFKFWQIYLAAVFSLGVMACSDQITELSLFGEGEHAASWMFLCTNVLIFAGMVAALSYGAAVKEPVEDADEKEKAQIAAQNRSRRANSGAAILAMMALEAVLMLVNFGINFTGTSVTHYPRGTEYAASMIRYMHEREEDTFFYRAETTHSQTLNDGALNGYNGISAFTSSANVKVTEFMQTLGYGAKNTFNRYCYEEASPVSNLFLNLKYMIERSGDDKDSSCFTELHRYGDVALLQNNYYLPLGFLAEETLVEYPFSTDYNGFRFQNDLMQATTGLDEEVWWILGGSNFDVTGEDVEIKNADPNGYCSYEADLKGATITYTFTVPKDGFMCVSLDFPKRNDVSIWKNGNRLYSENMSLEQMLAVGDVRTDDEILIKATCKNANEKGSLTVSAAVLDLEAFARSYDVLAASTLELSEFSTTKISGTIDCNRDGLLYTSIPQNGNWFAFVDGESMETVAVGEAMVAVMLTEGTHEVTFEYHNVAFDWGWKISAVCALIFAVLLYVDKQKHMTVGKYEKKEKR